MSPVELRGTGSVKNVKIGETRLVLKVGGSMVPQSYYLSQNYPNPFNPVTIFKFDISKKSAVKVVIYNVLGKEIEELVNAELSPGTYAARWIGTNYPSGIYFYSLQTEAFSETKQKLDAGAYKAETIPDMAESR